MLCVFIGLLTFLVFTIPSHAQNVACPDGFRLHYQGFCINKADEIIDDPVKGVRSAPPLSKGIKSADELERVGYKFSNMIDGWFCKDIYLEFTEGRVQPPSAMAMGAQSCGRSDPEVDKLEAARKTALKACQAQTTNCRIIVELAK